MRKLAAAGAVLLGLAGCGSQVGTTTTQSTQARAATSQPSANPAPSNMNCVVSERDDGIEATVTSYEEDVSAVCRNLIQGGAQAGQLWNYGALPDTGQDALVGASETLHPVCQLTYGDVTLVVSDYGTVWGEKLCEGLISAGYTPAR